MTVFELGKRLPRSSTTARPRSGKRAVTVASMLVVSGCVLGSGLVEKDIWRVGVALGVMGVLSVIFVTLRELVWAVASARRSLKEARLELRCAMESVSALDSRIDSKLNKLTNSLHILEDTTEDVLKKVEVADPQQSEKKVAGVLCRGNHLYQELPTGLSLLMGRVDGRTKQSPVLVVAPVDVCTSVAGILRTNSFRYVDTYEYDRVQKTPLFDIGKYESILFWIPEGAEVVAKYSIPISWVSESAEVLMGPLPLGKTRLDERIRPLLRGSRVSIAMIEDLGFGASVAFLRDLEGR